MANNLLISLKTKETSKLESLSLKELIETSVELSQVYLEGKDIEFQIENAEDIIIMADYEKLLGVIINLVKNLSKNKWENLSYLAQRKITQNFQ